jgi:MFS family permease
MVVLDASVVIIALPSAQRALHISTANRQWMLTAYTLAFAGLLLLGGGSPTTWAQADVRHQPHRLRRPPPPSGGLAQNEAMLFGARALQGAFAAVMAPGGALAAHRGLHRAQGAGPGLRRLRRHRRRRRRHRPHPRRRLTEYASWRWTLLINVPIAIVAAIAAPAS